jgi:glutathione S-transferase
MSITVHHLELSRSTRVLWMLEELGLEYEIKTYQRDPVTIRAPKSLAEVHPLGRAPVVSVDGHTLAESGAILEYFAEKHGQLAPTEPGARIRYRFWMHYAEGSLMPPLLVKLIMARAKVAKVPFFVKPIVQAVTAKVDEGYSDPAIEQHFSFIEGELAARPYFAGEDFSAADIQMVYPIAAGLERAAGERPNARAWLERVQARPAFQRAIERGGPMLID